MLNCTSLTIRFCTLSLQIRCCYDQWMFIWNFRILFQSSQILKAITKFAFRREISITVSSQIQGSRYLAIMNKCNCISIYLRSQSILTFLIWSLMRWGLFCVWMCWDQLWAFNLENHMCIHETFIKELITTSRNKIFEKCVKEQHL